MGNAYQISLDGTNEKGNLKMSYSSRGIGLKQAQRRTISKSSSRIAKQGFMIFSKRMLIKWVSWIPLSVMSMAIKKLEN